MARAGRVLIEPPVERLGMIARVVHERRGEDGVDGPEIIGRIDPVDLDPVGWRAWLDRSIEVDLHVPVMADRPEAPGAGHRRRGSVGPADRVAEPRNGRALEQLGRTSLDPVEQRRADAAPAVVGMDDAPRSDDARLLQARLPIRDDGPRAIDHDPGVGGQVEVRPAPNVPDEEGIERRVHAVRSLVGEEHLAYGVGVVLVRRPVSVTGGEIHARSLRGLHDQSLDCAGR